MARERNKLTALRVRAIKEPGRYSDGGGLYLYVNALGSRYWIFRYRDRITGKLRDKGLGTALDVTLEHARQRATACRLQLLDNSDPIDSAQMERQAARLRHAHRVTFGYCCERYIAAHRASWRNGKHAGQWTSTLTTYCKL